MKKNILLLGLLLTSSAFALNDGFNFSECSGSGSFEQQIQHYGEDYENAITVGTIPIGIEGLNIELTSDKDVDIRLYGQNNDKIVHWPYGLLSHATEGTTAYQGTEVTYSGYNGLDEEKGHEYIHVSGTTQVPMTMKAFGYQAGFATVNYSWSGKEGCDNSGDGNFTQSIAHDALTLVGEIPAGVPNVRVELTSTNDLDIQLYGEDGTVIVGWKPAGLLSSDRVDSIDYHGMTIEWSGYNGTNDNKGNEYIQITGNTTEVLTMKVYGYEAGFAEVTYSWYETPPTPTPTVIPTPTPTPNICGDIYEPVCGIYNLVDCPDDDQTCGMMTFGNMCELEHTYEMSYLHDGECNNTIEPTAKPTPTPTPTPQPCPDIYEPMCGQLPDCYTTMYGEEVCYGLPIPIETFSNMCELEQAGAMWVSDGQCSENNNTNQQYMLNQNLALWYSYNMHDYKFMANASIEKAIGQVEVLNGGVTSIIGPNGYPQNASYIYNTFQDYFNIIETLINTPGTSNTFTYDTTYGFPTSIHTDDINYTIDSFSIINAPVCGTMDFSINPDIPLDPEHPAHGKTVECMDNQTGCQEITYPSMFELENAGAAYLNWGECKGVSHPCTDDYAPACGHNFNLPNTPWITYDNECKLHKAGAHFEYSGECQVN